MKEHPSSTAVQENGCSALCNLTSNHDANQVKASGCGAIEAVVAALLAHLSSSAVQQSGCTALRILAANANNQVKAGGCGAIEAVVAALRVNLLRMERSSYDLTVYFFLYLWNKMSPDTFV